MRIPEGFTDHVLVRDAVVGQRLAPHWVQGVAQGLGAKFVGLTSNRKHICVRSEPSSGCTNRNVSNDIQKK